MTGTVFNIQSFCIHDGPSIRTTVFLKGCPLRCFWCHNPESISPKKELMISWHKCIGCNKCFESCPSGALVKRDGVVSYIKQNCTLCETCIDVCPSEVYEVSGKEYTEKEILDIVEKDRPFFGDEGGVTFSGGEPTLQIDFLYALLKEAKDRGLNTAVDTCGFSSYENYSRILPLTDLFLFDIKGMDSDVHKESTGVDNKLIIENLKKLSKDNANIWIRMPIIPGVNDSKQNVLKACDLLCEIKPQKIELMPYHKIGSNKYDLLKRDYKAENLEIPSFEKMTELRNILKQKGLNVVV